MYSIIKGKTEIIVVKIEKTGVIKYTAVATIKNAAKK